MKTKILPADHPHAISHALDVLHNNGIVAFPTDTVYGIAAMVFDEAGVKRLYSVKGRSHVKAIAVLLHNVGQLAQVSENLSEDALIIGKHFWPGPVTLIVPKHPAIPDAVSLMPTLGVRVPDHPVALALLAAAGPLAATSANMSGAKNTRTAKNVLVQLDGRVHLILDGGRTPGGVPSTVVDLTTPAPKILRPGPVRLSEIKKILG